MKRWLGIIISTLLVSAALSPALAADKEETTMETLIVSSPAFRQGESIPVRFTCDGSDVNPAIAIDRVPAAARSLILIMDDPDASVGTWVHWLLWNIPAQTRAIPENSVPSGAVQGRNSWKRNSYGGPCPPSGSHRYFFKCYALDTGLSLPATGTKAELEQAMQGHILAQGELLGRYRRQ